MRCARSIGMSGRLMPLLGNHACPRGPGHRYWGIQDSGRRGKGTCVLASEDLVGPKGHAAGGSPDREDPPPRLDIVPSVDGGQKLHRFGGSQEPLISVVADGQFGWQVAEEAENLRSGNQLSRVVDLGMANPDAQAGPRELPVLGYGCAPTGRASSNVSVARIGAPARRARATASLGRESISTSRPCTWRTRLA